MHLNKTMCHLCQKFIFVCLFVLGNHFWVLLSNPLSLPLPEWSNKYMFISPKSLSFFSLGWHVVWTWAQRNRCSKSQTTHKKAMSMLSTRAEITIKGSAPLDVVVYTCLECNNCRHKTARFWCQFTLRLCLLHALCCCWASNSQVLWLISSYWFWKTMIRS